jgi:hypothetical protein
MLLWNNVDRLLARRTTSSVATGFNEATDSEDELDRGLSFVLITDWSGWRDGESPDPVSGVPSRARRRDEIFSISPPSPPVCSLVLGSCDGVYSISIH